MPKGKNAAALFEVIGRGRSAEGVPSATRTPAWWWKRPAAGAATSSPTPAEPLMVVDHDRQMVRFTLSISTSIVIAFGVLVLVGISYLLGEHVGRKLGPMTAITSEDLLKSSPNPQVLQVQPGANSPADHTEPPADDQQSAQQPPDQSQPAQQAPTSADRQVGLNYVIMQSYPPEMRSSATEAQTALLLHGVPCTIEPAPTRLRLGKGWLSVIGTTGFTSISGTEFKTYVRHIDLANAELHGKFKKLRPLAYKWR